MESGKGIYAEVLDKQLYCGNEKFSYKNSIEINTDIKVRINHFRMQGKEVFRKKILVNFYFIKTI